MGGRVFRCDQVVGRVRGSGPDGRKAPLICLRFGENGRPDRFTDRWGTLLDGELHPNRSLQKVVGDLGFRLGDALICAMGGVPTILPRRWSKATRRAS